MPKGYIDRICGACGTAFKGETLRCKACLSNRAIKTFKYRIYPNKAEQEKLQWTLDKCREVYNAAIQERRDRYNIAIKRHPNYYDLEWRKQAIKEHAISLFDQRNQLSLIKKERTDYQDLSAAHILNDVCARVDKAFKAFLKKQSGYPRFQGKKRYNSFTYPDKSGWKLVPGEKKYGKLALTKIGDIKMRMHRPIEGDVKTCTIMREGPHWYVCFSCELASASQKLPLSYKDVGIDLGVSHAAALSDGSFIENPRHYRNAEETLANLQRGLTSDGKKRNKGGMRLSKRNRKRMVAKTHRKIRNQRHDFLHKESRKLVNSYQIIAHEDLKIKNMTKSPEPKQDAETGQYLPNGANAKGELNKSILDVGWGTFLSMIETKAKAAGRTVIPVPAPHTSQTCSRCGHCEKANRDRKRTPEFLCQKCGYTPDADTNASINILQRAYDTLQKSNPSPSLDNIN